MTREELYRSKMITLDQALDKIKSHDTIVVGHYGNEPRAFLRKVHTVADRVEDVNVWINNPSEVYPFITDNSLKGKIDILTCFYGAPLRKIHPTGRVTFAPHNIHYQAGCMMETQPPTVFVAAVTPMDEYGYVGLSTCQQIEREMFYAADLRILEVNPNVPRTIGTVQVPVADADFFYETDTELYYAPPTTATPEQKKIAEYVADLIDDGDTIQFGIGSLPNAVADALMDKHDLGVHTEMYSDAMAKLQDAGVITNQKKNLHPGQSICAFAWGSKWLYEYIDRNPLLRILQVSYVNDPSTIAKNDRMVSVNTALQIDLTGQICSESLGFQQYSGTGGATDFAYGAFHSKGGKGIIAVTSTAKGGTVSRIQPGLTYGSIVSISRNIVDHVVTEYGVAKLRGKTVRQRVDELINVAHPDFRAQLRADANKYMIW